MKIGFAMVSTQDQNLNMQINVLKNAGCEIILDENILGKSKERPELLESLEKLSVV